MGQEFDEGNFSQPMPTLWLYLPECPKCHGVDFDITHTVRHEDGSRTRRANCRGCGLRVRIVVERASAEFGG